jgi:hypothetical protein
MIDTKPAVTAAVAGPSLRVFEIILVAILGGNAAASVPMESAPAVSITLRIGSE